MNRPSISFTVHGVAQPKGSTRAFVPKGWTRPIITSSNKNLKGWEQTIRAELQVVMATTDRATLAAIFESPVAVGLRFHLPRPKSKPKAKYPTTKPDVDKLARAAIDALSGVAFKDDNQVVAVQARKVYADGAAKVEIIIDSWGERT